MADTYSQVNIHTVFSVKGRECLLLHAFEKRLYEYISGILKNINQFPLAVNGYRDHVHLFFELDTQHSIAEVVRIVKSNSSKWMNEQQIMPGYFAWQEGYGAFSYSRSQRNQVIHYILNQEKHHRQYNFKKEYLALLKKFEIDFKDQYVFEFFD